MIEKIGAIDFLPKVGIDALSDFGGKEDFAFSYWGALTVVVSSSAFFKNLPPHVKVVDNIDHKHCVLHMALENTPHVYIGNGCAPAVTSRAELLEDYHGLPWYHVCAKYDVRLQMVNTIKTIKSIAGVEEVFFCPSITSWNKVLVMAE